MVKKTLLLIFTAFALTASEICWAQEEKKGVETELTATSITVKGSTLSVHNANGSLLEIFSLTGVKVASIRIDSDEENINLTLKKGCYILKINKVVRKISIR